MPTDPAAPIPATTTPITKPASRSRTIRMSLLIFSGTLASILLTLYQTGQWPAQWAEYGLLVASLAFAYLRVLTSQGIHIIRPGGDEEFPQPPAEHNSRSQRNLSRPNSLLGVMLVLGMGSGLGNPALVNSALAGAPRAVITGPTAGVPGDTITLEASESVGDQFRWQVSKRNDDCPSSVRYQESSDRRSLQLNSYAGIYDVTLIAANQDGIDLAQWTVIIYGNNPPPPNPGPQPGPTPIPHPDPLPPNPDPNPNPNPNPNPEPNPEPTPTPTPPEPVFPPGKYGISQGVYEHARAVTSPTAPADAAAMIAAMETIISQIKSGQLKQGLYIAAAYSSACKSALADHTADWLEYSKWLQSEVENFWRNSQLQSPEDFIALINEIKSGLAPLAKG